MYIYSVAGNLLAYYSAWNISSVAQAEKWIKDNGYYIWKCEIQNGYYVITVGTMY